MDSCILFASAYLIPLMLPLYTVQHANVSISLQCHFIFDIMWKQFNMLYRNRNLEFFFFFCSIFLHSPHGVERNTCTQPDLQVAQLKLPCSFFSKWTCITSDQSGTLLSWYCNAPLVFCVCIWSVIASSYAFFHLRDIAALLLLSHVKVFIFGPFTLNMLLKKASQI